MMNRFSTVEELTEEYNNLNVTKYKLDTFFSLFLDKFDRKLKERKKGDPYWKLYDDKFKEYEDVTRSIAYVRHLLGNKGKHV